MSLCALSKTQTTRLEKVQSVLIMKRQLQDIIDITVETGT